MTINEASTVNNGGHTRFGKFAHALYSAKTLIPGQFTSLEKFKNYAEQ